jgi:hypothetical protein
LHLSARLEHYPAGCTFLSLARRKFLKIPQLQAASDPSATSSLASPRKRINAFAALAVLVCFGATSCSRTQVALSAAAMAAVIAGTTVAITLAVENHHHTLQGCVFSGQGGMELRTSDSKVYALQGSAATIKVGDRVKLHGSKLKKAKDSNDDQVFVVEKLRKDYGSCAAEVAAPATPAH